MAFMRKGSVPGVVAGLALAGALLAPPAFAIAGIRVIPGDRRSADIADATDVDQFLFAGPEGTPLSVTVRATSGNLQPTLSLTKADGSSVDISGNRSSGPGSVTLSSFPLPESGTFVLVVGGNGGSTGGYTLSVGRARIPAVARTVVVPVRGTTPVAFPGVEGGAVSFTVLHESGAFTRRPILLDGSMDEVPGTTNQIVVSGNGWAGRRVALFGGTETYTLLLVGPDQGQASRVRVSIKPQFALQGPTRIRVPEVAVVLDPTSSNESVSPATGPTTGGTVVTVTGDGFQPGITINLVTGTTLTPVGVSYVNAQTLQFTTPAHAEGTVDISLQNPGATAIPRRDAFTFTSVNQSRFFANGTGTALPVLSQSGDAFAGSRGAIADLNGDGLNDIVLQSTALLPGGASLRILQQSATDRGVFADATHGSIPDRFGGFDSEVDLGDGPGLAVGDLDGDGFPDIVAASHGTGYLPNLAVPLSDNGGLNIGYYEAPTTTSSGFFGLTQSCGKVGEYPIFWNDHYSATRVFKNDGNGNFFSSPLGSSGARRFPLVGFYAVAYDENNAEARAYAATFVKITDVANPLYPGYYKGDSGFVAGATGGERFEGDAVALGDLDGDGTLDVVVSRDAAVHEIRKVTFNRGGGLKPFDTFRGFSRPSTRVLLNSTANGGATGEFTESAFPLLDPSQFAFPDTGYGDQGQAADIGISDINGDGRPDIVLVTNRLFTLNHTRPGTPVTEYRPGTRVFVNIGGGRFDDATRSNMPTVDVAPASSPDFFAATRVALGDLDGDGDADMVITSPNGYAISGGRPWTRVLVNRNGAKGKPTGIFDDQTVADGPRPARMPPITGGEYWQANSISLHDIDGDGDLDIVLATKDPAVTGSKAGTRVLLNDGRGFFSDQPQGVAADTFVPPQGGGELWQGDLVLTGDLNGDGVPDLLISDDDPGQPNATRILFRQ